MILAQVRGVLYPTRFVEIGSKNCLACLTLHLHSIYTTSEPRKAWLISAPNVVLAMADVHSTCRISCWTHVRIRIVRIPGRLLTRRLVCVKQFYI